MRDSVKNLKNGNRDRETDAEPLSDPTHPPVTDETPKEREARRRRAVQLAIDCVKAVREEHEKGPRH